MSSRLTRLKQNGIFILKPYHDGDKVVIDSWDIPGLITKVHVDGTINDPSNRDMGKLKLPSHGSVH